MIESLINNPRKLSDREIEEYANDLVKLMSEKGMTYDRAWMCMNSHKQVFKEAIAHLGHNAVIEMKDNPVKFLLDEY